MNEKTFQRGMAELFEIFDKQLSPAGLELYWRAIRHIGDGGFRKAVERAAQRERFFPKPVVLLELSGHGGEDASIDAESKLLAAVAAHGAYESVDFADPAINAAVRSLGGWPALCAIEMDDWTKYRAREFKRLYESFSRREVDPDVGRYLPGIAERQNLLAGMPVKPPARIGGPESNDVALQLPANASPVDRDIASLAAGPGSRIPSRSRKPQVAGLTGVADVVFGCDQEQGRQKRFWGV